MRDLSYQSHFFQKWVRWLLNRCSTVSYASKPIQYSSKNGRFFFTNSKDNYLSVILSYLGYYFISITFYSIESIRRLWSEKLNCGFFQLVTKHFFSSKCHLTFLLWLCLFPTHHERDFIMLAFQGHCKKIHKPIGTLVKDQIIYNTSSKYFTQVLM